MPSVSQSSHSFVRSTRGLVWYDFIIVANSRRSDINLVSVTNLIRENIMISITPKYTAKPSGNSVNLLGFLSVAYWKKSLILEVPCFWKDFGLMKRLFSIRLPWSSCRDLKTSAGFFSYLWYQQANKTRIKCLFDTVCHITMVIGYFWEKIKYNS